MEAAWGILRVLATNVMVAMRTITIERGYDPRAFTLLPFGGMGPAIGGLIARELGIARILIPRDPGAFSAYGMLVTDVRQEKSLTRVLRLEEASPAQLETIFVQLEEAAVQDLLAERFARERIVTRRQAGMRYRGQSYEVPVEVPPLSGAHSVADLIGRFHAAHQRRYGHMAQREAVEIVNFQAIAIGLIPKPAAKKFAGAARRPASARGKRQVYFSGSEHWDVPVWHRNDLLPGMFVEGPAVVEEKTSTIVLYPGQHAQVDEYSNLAVKVADNMNHEHCTDIANA